MTRYSIKLLISCWAAVGIMSLIGCGNSSDNQPATAINKNESSTTKSDNKGSDSGPSNFDLTHPKVIIETTLGNMVFQLDAEKAPLTVDNFLAYVDAGQYDQTIFHQVYRGQGILAGGYTTNLTEIRARTAIRNEAHNGLKNRRGTIAMVRHADVTDSATSQFFINVADNPALDYHGRTPEEYGYCVFGKVASEMDMEVADRIAAVEVQDGDKFDSTPRQMVVVKSIRRAK
jgi:peptidyl-prolyl cis-trans isomerase A (cyclophilin A)